MVDVELKGKKCHACGTNDAWTDFDCQPGGPGISEGEWKLLFLCEPCYIRLDPDMWTCQDHYELLNPVTPFKDLPDLEEAHRG